MKGIPIIQKQVASFLSQLREGSICLLFHQNHYKDVFIFILSVEFSVKKAPTPQSPPPIPEPAAVAITKPPPTTTPTTTTTTKAPKEKRYLPILISSSIIVMALYFVNHRLR